MTDAPSSRTTGAALRSTLERGALPAAPLLLGATLTSVRGGERVAVRLTEVEAYEGERDPGSHGFRGRTERTAVMFGPVGHVYVYFTYGMHWCMNIVCGPEGACSAVLLRAGEITQGLDVAARRRRQSSRARPQPVHQLASGPARLAQALGLGRGDDGASLQFGPPPEPGGEAESPAEGLWLEGVRSRRHPGTLAGPRTGVSGPGGTEDFPWRFWLPEEPSVSRYRAAAPRRTPG